jgi:MFS family permease
LRLTLYTIGAVVGPLAAMTIMSVSGDNFRLVFAVALIPGFASVLVVLFWIKEAASDPPPRRRLLLHRDELASLSWAFWWAIAIAAMLSLARFSPAFLVLKAHEIRIDAAFVPVILIFMYIVYSAAAYPFGVLADRIDRRMQLGAAIMVLVAADAVLAFADTPWMTMVGGALWGLQMGMTQGLLSATIADAAPERLRGTAFGIFDLIIGVTTFVATAGAGALWAIGGPAMACSAAAVWAVGALLLLLIRVPRPR